jgi:hypothetical protein
MFPPPSSAFPASADRGQAKVLTLDTYSHLVPTLHEQAAAAMDDLLSA